MNRLKYFILPVFWLFGIVYASLSSSDQLKGVEIDIPNIDKLVHFVMYFGLSFLAIWSFKKVKLLTKRTIFLCLLFSIAIGILMEYLQLSLTSTRNFEIFDIIANIIGATLGTVPFIRKKMNL